jgi:5-hydroxyisourate hydrolase-like protein (transthyretin family)
MRFMLLLMLCCGCALTSQAQTAKPDARTAVLSGRVTIEGKPAAGVTVTADYLEQRGALREGESFQARTDAEGRYEFTHMPRGRYQLHCASDAYVQEAADARPYRNVALDEGEALQDVDFALVRGGVVTGRVTDADARPLIEEFVQLEELGADGQTQNMHGNAYRHDEHHRTDDRGVYRLFGLKPGRYRVFVGSQAVGFGDALPVPQTYHPSAALAAEAKVIEVKAGAESENVDIRVLRDERRWFSASGKVTDAATAQPVGNAIVTVERIPAENETGDNAHLSSHARVDAAGNFTVKNLRSGRYRMRLQQNNQGGGLAHYGEPFLFTLSEADVTGLDYQVRRGATVSGTVVVEGATNADRTMQMDLWAHTERDEAVFERQAHYSAGAQVKVGEAFRFTGVPPGRLMMQGEAVSLNGERASPVMLLRIEQDGVALPDGLVVGEAADVSGVRLVFTRGTAMVQGTVQIKNGTLPAGYVIQVYAQRRQTGAWTRPFSVGGQADNKGRFVLAGVVAGEYEFHIYAHPGNRAVSSAFPHFAQLVPETVTVAPQQTVPVTLTLDVSKREPQ